MSDGSETNLWLMGLKSADFCSGSLTSTNVNNSWMMLPLFLAALVIALPYIDQRLAKKTSSKPRLIRFITASLTFIATIILTALTAYYLFFAAIEIARLLSDRCNPVQDNWQVLAGFVSTLLVIGTALYLKFLQPTQPVNQSTPDTPDKQKRKVVKKR